jgi:hypothetical protein
MAGAIIASCLAEYSNNKSVAKSQTLTVLFIGLVAMGLQMGGVITLTAEQIAGIGAFFLTAGAVARVISDGAKLVFRQSRIAQDLVAGQMPDVGDLQADIQAGTVALNTVAQAATEAGLTGDQVQKLLTGLQAATKPK